VVTCLTSGPSSLELRTKEQLEHKRYKNNITIQAKQAKQAKHSEDTNKQRKSMNGTVHRFIDVMIMILCPQTK